MRQGAGSKWRLWLTQLADFPRKAATSFLVHSVSTCWLAGALITSSRSSTTRSGAAALYL